MRHVDLEIDVDIKVNYLEEIEQLNKTLATATQIPPGGKSDQFLLISIVIGRKIQPCSPNAG